MQLRHIAPPVVYEDSPLSFMVEGGACAFYTGEGEEYDDTLCDDPSVLTYYVIRPLTRVKGNKPSIQDEDSDE